MENKWEAKEVGEESYAITNGKITIATSDADNDQYLQAIADLLNSSGFRFHSENKLELDLHIEAEMAKMELIELKAKCERYEAALKEAKETINWMWQHMKEPDGQTLLRVDEFNRPANGLHIIDEALSIGEGEPVSEGGKIIVCNNSEAFRYWTANIKGYRIAHKGHATVVWLPKGMTSEIFAKEWGEYENANNPAKQKETKP